MILKTNDLVQIPTLPLPELCDLGKVSSTFWASVSWFLNRVLKSYLSHWVVMRVKRVYGNSVVWNQRTKEAEPMNPEEFSDVTHNKLISYM